MARAVVYVAFILISVFALLLLPPTEPTFGVAAGLAIGFLVPLIDLAAANGRYFRLAWYSVRFPRSRIRLSISYLFRIRAGDKYLLLKGRRFADYIPVGGVYKVSPG